MSLSRLFYYNLNISNGSIIASHNSNTIGNIFTTAGNVGIGTTAPLFNLDINGTTRISGNVTIGSNLIVIGPTLQIPTGNIASRPITPQNGSIRYNSETQQFEGYGPGGAWGSLGGVIDIAQTTRILASATPSTTDGNLYFITMGTERMRINSSGNIGIGTTSPSFNLDINGSARISNNLIVPIGNTISRPSGQNGSIRYNTETQQFEGYGPGGAWGSLGGVIDIAQTTKVLASATPSTTDGNLYFITTGTERMRINSSGNIGIGTTLPSFNLDVAGTIRGTTVISTNITSTNLTVTNLTASNFLANTINYGISSIFSGSFSASNNVSSPTNITGFSFSSSDIRAFQATVTISILRSSGGNLYQNHIIDGFQTESGWTLYTSNVGDTTGVEFYITSQGQLQYTSTNLSNFISNTIRFSVIQIANTGTYAFNNNLTQGTLLFDSIQIQNTKNSIIGTDPGSLQVLGGSTFQKGVNILTTENSIGLGTGGGLTILGGTAISKDLLVGGNLEITGLTDTLNLTSTNITFGTLTLSTGLTSNLAQITNINSTNISSSNILGTNFSGSNLSLSNNLNVSGTLTVVNITSTNLMDTNLTVGTARITSNLIAIGNSNTIGSIFTTGGNIGIGTTAPTTLLHINGNMVLPTRSRITTNIVDNFIHSNNTVGHYSLSWNTDNVNGDAAYLSGYAGIKLFTSGQNRLFLDANGSMFTTNDIYMDNGRVMLAKNASGIYENFLWPRWTDDVMYLNYGKNGFHIRNNNSGTAMFMTSDGKVGVGTESPAAKLHISGDAGSLNSATRAYFAYFEGLFFNTGGWSAMSIYASSNIVSGAYIVSHNGSIAASDSRIKVNIKDIDPNQSLSIIKQLKPKTYQYKDKIKHEEKIMYGFVAQDVKTLVPDAIHLLEKEIPNIFELADVSNENKITLTKNSTSIFEINDQIMLYDSKNNEIKAIITKIIDDHTFIIDKQLTPEQINNENISNKIFVYGQIVNDFHHLNKEHLFTIATSALQEVDQQLQTTKTIVSNQQIEINNLKQEIIDLKNIINNLITHN